MFLTDGPHSKGNDAFIGYCADLAREIAERVGFNYIISPVKDGKYGGKYENLEWNGMVGELVRHVRIFSTRMEFISATQSSFSYRCCCWVLLCLNSLTYLSETPLSCCLWFWTSFNRLPNSPAFIRIFQLRFSCKVRTKPWEVTHQATVEYFIGSWLNLFLDKLHP